MKSRLSVVDLAWGYSAQLLNLAAGVLLLPLLALHAVPEVVGLWLVFITLVSLAQLIELGLQPTLARAVAYAHAGVSGLRSEGLAAPVASDGRADEATLLALQRTSKRLYRYAAALTCALLLVTGTMYVRHVLRVNPGVTIPHVYLAWTLFAAGTVLNNYFGYYVAFIQGRGRVTQCNQVMVLGKTVFLVLGAMFTIFDGGLLGLGAASFIAAFCGRLLAMKFYTDGKVADGSAAPSVDWRLLLPNAARLIIVQFGTFLILRATVLIGANFLSLTEVASYGITVQVLMVLSGLASLTLNLQMPRMNAAQARGDKVALRGLLGSAVLLAWLVFWGGAAVSLVAGDVILEALGKGTSMLPPGPLLVLTTTYFLEMNHSVFATYLTTLNRVPFMAAAIVSGACTVVLALALCDAGLGIWGLILAPALVQATYNNWKWPLEALRDVGADLWTILRAGGSALTSRSS